MIAEGLRRQIELVLWPLGDSTPGSVWAVLDCARERRIYRELAVSRLDYQCLYSGNLPTALKVVAPHMVELGPRYGFTSRLLSEGWGRSWGLFVRINDSTQLRHHLRKFLRVKTEDGRALLFRYYDPRVMRRYLPTCTPEELEQVFGPITAFLMEGPAPDNLLEYTRVDGRLSVRSHALALPTPA
jgi:Domain of unknown function (DUF4123)